MSALLLARKSELICSIGIAWSLCLKTLVGRYARSYLGMFWLVLTPLAMLGLYWGVFGFVLGVSWPAEPGRVAAGYIVPFMAGLAVFSYFSEAASGALRVFVSRRNYVRKSPLPLWVLWLSNFMGATIVGGVNLALLTALTLAHGILTLEGLAWAVPVTILIVAMFGGLSMILALIGPFVGDVANMLAVILRFLFYTAPITYPLSLVPEAARSILWINPLTTLVEMLRQTLVFGTPPSPTGLTTVGVAALALAALAAWLYGRVADAVRDVV